MSFMRDFHDANVDWNAIKPELLKHIKGDLVDIESMSDSALAGMFDKYAGIDAIQIVNEQMRGVAIRVQWGSASNYGVRLSRTLFRRDSRGARTDRRLPSIPHARHLDWHAERRGVDE